MGHTKLFHEGEANTDALVFAARRIIRLPEPAEYIGKVRSGNTHAGIGNDHDEFLALLFGAKFDAATGWAKCQSIEDQVENDLFQVVAIRHDSAESGIDIGFQSEPFLFGDRAGGTRLAFDKICDVHRPGLDDDCAGFEPDKIEQVV